MYKRNYEVHYDREHMFDLRITRFDNGTKAQIIHQLRGMDMLPRNLRHIMWFDEPDDDGGYLGLCFESQETDRGLADTLVGSIYVTPKGSN